MTERFNRDHHPTAFRIRDWTIHPRLNLFEGPDAEVQVEPRLMEVLLCLAETPGEVLSRNDLLDRVWGDIVVGEEALTRAVSELRRVLGDDTQSPLFIQTIRKGGYRLLPAVELVDPISEGITDEIIAVGSPATSHWRWWLLAIPLVISAIWFGTHQRSTPPPEPITKRPLQTIPLTSYAGNEIYAALSFDGSAVAFAWDGVDEDNFDIFVKQVGEESPLRLTDDPGVDDFPVWGPDGQSISYVHRSYEGQGVWSVPLLGGEPRELFRAHNRIFGFSWLDEKTIVYGDFDSKAQACNLYRRNLETGEDNLLLEKSTEAWDFFPTLGPDGVTLAFVRFEKNWIAYINILNLETGLTRRLTAGYDGIEGICWDREGGSVLFSARSGGDFTLWRVALEGGAVTWVPLNRDRIFFPSVARGSDRMAYHHSRFEKNVWQITLDDDPTVGLFTNPLISSSFSDIEACFSPDGKYLAFSSNRSGNDEIWICRADGDRPSQLTEFDGPKVSTPRWSPDGLQLVLAARTDGFAHLFVADNTDRSIRQITTGRHHDFIPTWSADGRWIYCCSNRDGQWRIWKVSASGDSTIAAVLMVEGPGSLARESADGQHLYFSRQDQAGLWRLPLAEGLPAGSAVQVLDDLPRHQHEDQWDYYPGGLVLLDRDDTGPFLMRHEFATGVTSKVSYVPNVVEPSLAISPDGRHLLYSRIENRVVDLVLVDGFK